MQGMTFGFVYDCLIWGMGLLTPKNILQLPEEKILASQTWLKKKLVG
jgi:hypothetical protein